MKITSRILALFCVMAMVVTGFAIPQKANAFEPAVIAEDLSSLTFLGAPLGEYTVVLGSDATVGIKNTVDYFIRYIKEATGAELSIAAEGEVNDYEICIGKTDRETEKVTAAREGLSRSGVAVVADGTKIFLTGYGEQGVIYSMYQFLEDYLGYRFYANDYQIAKLEYARNFPLILITPIPPFSSAVIWTGSMLPRATARQDTAILSTPTLSASTATGQDTVVITLPSAAILWDA